MSNPAASILIVDKPAGITSHGVVSRVRRAAGTRKVGHAGTLDPMATGVLVIGIESATRLLGYLTGHDKVYAATIRLGFATTTDDAEGEPLGVSIDTSEITDEAIGSTLEGMVGDILQRPSSVSAIKVDGRRSYARVRSGEDVQLPERPVRINSIGVSRIERTLVDGTIATDVDVVVSCSAGTYIRAIARDLGEALGVGGHLIALRRTASGPFDVSEAIALDDLDADSLSAMALSPAQAASRSFPCVEVDIDSAVKVSHGIKIPVPGGQPATALIGEDGRLLALADATSDPAGYLAVFPA